MFFIKDQPTTKYLIKNQLRKLNQRTRDREREREREREKIFTNLPTNGVRSIE